MAKLFCEMLAQDVLPEIRAMIAEELIYQYKFTQFDAAKALGVSQPAISQYLRHLRGGKRILNNGLVENKIKSLCQKIDKYKNQDISIELCNICRLIINEKNNIKCPASENL